MDYTCFIQRNGQCLYTFRRASELGDESDGSDGSDSASDPDYMPDTCGVTTCCMVHVLTIHSLRDILSWKLDEFKKFPLR